MAKKPEQPTPAVPTPLPVSAAASAHAPFVYFEGAPTFGHMNGVIHVTLDALRMYPGDGDGQVRTDRVLVAHLRMSIKAAHALKGAIDGARLLILLCHKKFA